MCVSDLRGASLYSPALRRWLRGVRFSRRGRRLSVGVTPPIVRARPPAPSFKVLCSLNLSPNREGRRARYI